MNCQTVQNKILTLPDPRVIPDPLLEHVAKCPGCKVWAKQAARLEGLLERLPVPAPTADRKAAFIAALTGSELEFLGDPALTRPVTPATRPGFATTTFKFLRRHLTNVRVVGSLAAAILLVGGWLIWRSSPKQPDVARGDSAPEHPLLKKLVERDVALAKADNPGDRLLVLGGLADDLSMEARGLARVASPDELKALAGWFDKVKDGMVKQARKMPGNTPSQRTERQAQFDGLAGKLAGLATETEKMVGDVPVDSKPYLKQIVDSAREGEKALRLQAKAGN